MNDDVDRTMELSAMLSQRTHELEKLAQELRDATAAYEKQKKQNGALQIALQEAHRDVDALKKPNVEEMQRHDGIVAELLLEIEEYKRLLDQARQILTDKKLWREGPWYERVAAVISRPDVPRCPRFTQKRQDDKKTESAPILCPHQLIHEKGWGSCRLCTEAGVPQSPERSRSCCFPHTPGMSCACGCHTRG